MGHASTILGLFLGEAVALSALGGVIGLGFGLGLAQLIHLAVPALSVHTPLSFVLLAEALAIVIVPVGRCAASAQCCLVGPGAGVALGMGATGQDKAISCLAAWF